MSDLSTFKFSLQEEKEIKEFCKLNELDYVKFIKECFDKGYQIEKYGLLTIDGQTIIEKEVIKEVIKEVPVEVIKEVIKEVEIEVINEVIIEKPVEIIREIIKEVPIEVIKEVVNEVPVEIIKEVIIEKEVEIPIEKIVEKEIYITDDTQVNELLLKIQQLENREPEVIEKEIIKEVEVIKEIEKPIEIIKEVIKEVEIIKETENKEKQEMLQNTIKTLREDIRKKDEIILQLEKNVVELQEIKGPIKAQYMRSSNLNDNLYR